MPLLPSACLAELHLEMAAADPRLHGALSRCPLADSNKIVKRLNAATEVQ